MTERYVPIGTDWSEMDGGITQERTGSGSKGAG